MKEEKIAVWHFYSARSPHKPVIIRMDFDVLGALIRLNDGAWSAIIEYVENHVAAREDS